MIISTISRFVCAAFVLVATAAFGRPAFVDQPLEPAGLAVVQSVVAGSSADFVLLAGGLSAGYRSGMVAKVERESAPVGRILIVEATADQAVALILELAPGQNIQSEDRVLRSLISIS